MNQSDLKTIIDNLYKNKLTPEEALKQLQNFPYENMDFAKIDHQRELRSQDIDDYIGVQRKRFIDLIPTIDPTHVFCTSATTPFYETGILMVSVLDKVIAWIFE